MILGMKYLKILGFFSIAALLIYEFIGFSYFNASDVNNNWSKQIYVISLDRTPERFTEVKKQTDAYNLAIEKISATDGYDVFFVNQKTKDNFKGKEIQAGKLANDMKYDIYCSESTYKEKLIPDFIYNTGTDYKRLFSAGEVGLICSTRRLWHKIASEDQIALILEDDIILGKDFDKKLQNIFASLPEKWDIIYLDSTNHTKNTNVWFKNLKIVNGHFLKIHSRQSIWGTYGYIINKNSAKKLLELYDQNSELPTDSFLSKMIRKSKIHALISVYKIADVKRDNSEIQKMGRDPKYL